MRESKFIPHVLKFPTQATMWRSMLAGGTWWRAVVVGEQFALQ